MNENSPLILVVDDNTTNLQVIGNLLSRSGYRLVMAESGLEALEVVRNSEPDLILLDIMMPRMNGFEVCDTLKSDPKTAHIPIIFVTAHGDHNSISTGFEKGGVDYIVKPYQIKELLARVNTHVTLIKQSNRLKELNLAKSRLLSLLGHDLNNSMSAILAGVELLLDEDGVTEMESREILEQMHKHAKGTSKILLDLMEWARVLNDNRISMAETVSVREILDAVGEELEESLNRKQLRYRIETEDSNKIQADRNILTIIVRNLVGNAIKFSHRGGEIIGRGYEKNGYCMIEVEDHGIGMKEEEIQKILNLDNFQSSRGTENEKGTGLGLVLSQEFLKKSGGRLMVSSNKGEGATFTIQLPLQKT